jgi:glycerophosphoryl diester phosphodiesterase
MGHFDFIELDIQPSRDGLLVVLHDDTLERTTDIDRRTSAPRPHRLGHYDFAFLRTLDAGSWFAKNDPFGTLASGEIVYADIAPQTIPTLDEVLALCAQHTMPANIEIKDSPCADPETLLIDLLKAIAPYRDRIPMLVSSFNHRYLARLSELDTTLALAANVEHTHPPQLLLYLQNLGVCAYHVDAPLIESTPVDMLTNSGITCGAFTLNTPEEQEACFERGFRAVFADEAIGHL